MTKKPFLILFFLMGGLVFQNCSDDPDCNFGPTLEFFDIQNVEVNHLSLDGSVLDNNEISFGDYGFLRLNFVVDYIADHQAIRNDFSLINSVYGCTPEPPGQLGSKEESFELFEIVTINDYDEEHKAGESINDILELVDFENSPILFDDFLNELSGNVPRELFAFKLLNGPTINKEFQVRVNVNLSTGEEYEVLSSVVNFE